MDGRKQRNALTAAEQAIASLAAGEPDRAAANAAKAAELDQIGVYAGFPAAVAGVVAGLGAGTAPSPQGWEQLRQALPDGPLQALVDAQLQG